MLGLALECGAKLMFSFSTQRKAEKGREKQRVTFTKSKRVKEAKRTNVEQLSKAAKQYLRVSELTLTVCCVVSPPTVSFNYRRGHSTARVQAR